MGGIKAEGVVDAGQQGHPREAGRTGVGVDAGEGQAGAGEAGDQEVVAREAGDGARDREGGAVLAGAGDAPGLVGAEDDRRADEDGARVVLDRDAFGRIGRGDREGVSRVGTALGDRHAGDARRGRGETQAADGEIAVERGHVGAGGGAGRGAEDQLVGDAREALGVDEAGGVGREVGVVVGVVERRPAHVGADAPVKLGRQGRGGERDGRIGARQAEGVAAEVTEIAERVGRAGQAARGRAEEIVGAGGETRQAGEVDDDALGGHGRRGGRDPVEGREAADVEAERGRAERAGAEVEDARAEGDLLPDGVVEVQDRAGVDLDRGGARSGGAAAGEVETAAEDGGLADVRERLAGQRERADAGLDDADVVLVEPGAADGAVEEAGDVLVDRQVRDRRGAADDGVAGDLSERADDDGSARAGAAGDGDDRGETRTIETRIRDGDARDDAFFDRGHGLRGLRAHEAADGVEADDRGGGETLARVHDREVRGLHAGHAGKRGDGLMGSAVGVAELQHPARRTGTGADEQLRGGRQAVVGAAAEDEAAVVHAGGTGEGAGRGQGEGTRAGLDETADADAGGAADRAGEDQVVRGHVQRAARRKEGEVALGEVIRETGRQAEGAAGQGQVAEGAADVVEVRDLQDAFVDGGAPIGGRGGETAHAAAGDVRAGEHEGASAGLGEVTGGSQRGRDDGREARGDRRRSRVDDVEEVLVRRAGQQHAAVEAGEGGDVITPEGRRAVQGEEESPAAIGEARAGGAGDGEGAGGVGGRIVMQDEGVDGRVRADGKVAGQGFADVLRGLEDIGEGRVVVVEVQRAQAEAEDVGRERVAHVRLGDRAVDARVIVRDQPRGDALVEGDGREGLGGGRRVRGDAELERGAVDDVDHVGPRRDARAGDAHERLEARGGGDRDGRAAQRGRAGGQRDVRAGAADHGVDEVRLGAGVADEPVGRIGVAGGDATERTAADHAGGEVATDEARGAEDLAHVALHVHGQVARARVEVEVIDVLRARGVAGAVPDEEAERHRVGEVRTGDQVGARTGGGIEEDVGAVADAVGLLVDGAQQIERAVAVDRDGREIASGDLIVDTSAASVVRGGDLQRAGIDDDAAVVAAGVAEVQRRVAGESDRAQAHEFAVESRVLGLVDREGRPEAEVDERVVGIGGAGAARDRADGLAVGRGRLDHGRSGRRGVGRVAHHETLAGVDDEGLGRGDRLVGRAGQDEAVGVDGVDDDLEDAVEAGAGFGDGEVLVVDDAVVTGRRDLGDGGRGERDGARRGGGRGAERDVRVLADGGDVGAGRDARSADRLADDQAGGVGERDDGAGVGGRGAGDGDGREGDIIGRVAEADDGRAGVDAVAREQLSDAQAKGIVDLDVGRADGGGAGDTLGGVEADPRKADAVRQHAEVGGILVGEDDRRGVADGERAAAGPAEFDHARLDLDQTAEIIGQSAGAERQHAVPGLGDALETVDRRADQQALGRVEGVGVVEDVRRPAEGVVRDDELAGGRTQGAALDDGDRAGRHGDAGLGGDRGAVDEERGGVDDLRDAGAGGKSGTGDRHARDEAAGAGDADGKGADRGGAARETEVGSGRSGGLQDAAGDHLEDAAIRDGQQGRTRGVETHADRRDDVEQRAGIAGGVGDVLAVEHARERVAGGHGHGDDVRADAGGEAGRTRSVGDRDGGAQRADETGEEVVAGGGRDAVDGTLDARRQGQAHRAAKALRDRTEIEDQVASTGGIEVEGRVAARVTGGGGRQGQARDALADVEAGVTEERDATATQVDDTDRVDTIGDGGGGGRRVV